MLIDTATRRCNSTAPFVQRAARPFGMYFFHKGTYFCPVFFAFAASDWSLENGIPANGQTVQVNIITLPFGGYISDIEYRVDGGTWVSSGGLVDFQITGLPFNQEVTVELRAVCRTLISEPSDSKSFTPFVD